MGKDIYLLLGIIILSISSFSFSQSEFKISNPDIILMGNQIHITYNIEDPNTPAVFSVRLEVTDEGGNLLNAKSLSGDIGEGIIGGKDKKITWDLASDNIFINEDLYFQLYAKASIAPNLNTGKNNSLNKAGIIFRSVAFPGLGLSRLKGGPHWLKGLAGYGCIAGSIVLNNMAYNTNLKYLNNSGSSVEATKLLNKATQQDIISEILVYAAVGIWITDLVWTVAASTRTNFAFLNQKGISVGSDFDTLTKTPLVALRYNF